MATSLSNISRLAIRASPFDLAARGARELFRRVSSTGIKETNPKCNIVLELDLAAVPEVEIAYADGSKKIISASRVDVRKLLAELNH
eukprot:m.95978 g.95978  ORF g.95978 m.95978 type:complete len:87 (-) comp15175_c0_seq1:178-438(-)